MPGVATPPLILEGFGFAAGASYITNPIPFASQQPNPRASYTDGFPPQTVGATGTPPDVRDFTGILFAATQNIAALSAGQFFQFNTSISSQNSGYAAPSIVVAADGSGWWLNETSGNTNNPDTASAGSGWVPLAQYGKTSITGLTNANVTLTAPQAAKEIISLSGTLTGNVQIIFPTWNDNWLISNNTTGAFTVTCKTASGSGVICAQGQTTMIYGDGTNIVLVGSNLSASASATPNTLALRDGSAGLTAAYFNVSCDRIFKRGLRRIKGALEKIDLISGYTFKWLSGEAGASLIAQDFARVCPEGVRADKDGKLYLDPMAVIAFLVEALKDERNARVRLEKKVASL